jgi:hypothetical protein
MDWTLSEAEAASGAEGMEAFLRRADSQLRGDGGPIEGFTFLNDAREMLHISREIEGDLLATSSPTRLYVGFQNAGKFELEFKRYRELRRSGVSVFAFGEGEPDTSAVGAADAWYSLPTDHRKLENQWYLVTRKPEPIAFVGWEISDDALWGEHACTRWRATSTSCAPRTAQCRAAAARYGM